MARRMVKVRKKKKNRELWLESEFARKLGTEIWLCFEHTLKPLIKTVWGNVWLLCCHCVWNHWYPISALI